MGNCQSGTSSTSQHADDDCEPHQTESHLLAGTLLGELGIKSLLDRPDGRELQYAWHKFAVESDGIGFDDRDAETERQSEDYQHRGADSVDDNVLSSEACAEFLQSLSLQFGDGSWKMNWDLVHPYLTKSALFASNISAAHQNNDPNQNNLRGQFRRRRAMAVRMLSENRPAIFRKSNYRNASTTQNTASQLPISSELLASKAVQFEDVRSKIWDEPQLKGITASSILYVQRKFLQKLSQSSKSGASASASSTLTKGEAISLATEILNDVDTIPPSRKKRIISFLSIAARGGLPIDFVTFLTIVGVEYEKYSPSHDDGLRWRYNKMSNHSILPVECSKIISFAPPRDNTRTEILNCGEAVLTAMLNAVKSAKQEIMMSFWEFCLTLPGVRNSSLGNNAWIDDDIDINGDKSNISGIIDRSKTLLSVLKAKATTGVKVYIILNDVTIAWALVDYAIETLSTYDNIYIIRHPDWTVVTDTHHQKFVAVDRAIAVVGGVDWTVARWDLPSHPLFDPDSSIHPGLELSVDGKRFKKSISEYWKSPQEDLTQYRGETPCSLWQDVAVCIRGKAAADVAQNFIDRWEHARSLAMTPRIDPSFKSGRPSLDKMPSIPSKLNMDDYSGLEVNISTAPTPIYTGGFPSNEAASFCRCQVVRTLSRWSGTNGAIDTSHYEAWIYAINRAKEYIYIEQQYFVCSMGVSDARNRVAEAILDRIQQAVDQSKPFRVYVVIPATVYMTMVNHFTRHTLLQDGHNAWKRYRRNEKSLMTRIRLLLKRARPGTYWDGKDAESLLSVCFLSSAGKSSSGRWDVGEIFVHSKVLIVDDKIAVIGSANVNDRSFIGTSDSELGVILTDDDAGAADSRKIGCVRDFRLRLWRQYLGLSLDGKDDASISNPSSYEVYNLWHSTSVNNQKIISSVFDHFPSNQITSFNSYAKRKSIYNSKNPAEREASLNDPDRLEEVRGLLTQYPPKFMGDDKKRTLLNMFLEELPMKATL